MHRRLVALSLLALVASCARNPVTGKRQLSLVGERQEVELGQQARGDVAQAMGLYRHETLEALVAGVGQRLAQGSERPELPWSFEILDDAAVNAFALPGGPIFITRGLLTHLNSEAELAAVLGHEIGHVTARHAVNLLSKQQLAQLGLGLGTVLLPEDLRGLGQLANVGTGLLFLRYGRDAERQSDELAFRYALEQGYAVQALPRVFTTLGRAGEQEAGRLPRWLSTHPDPEDRVGAAKERLAQMDEAQLARLEEGKGRYLEALDQVVFGENPRHGFFEQNAFLHPELRFKVELPPGWKGVNQASAVTAISPGEDAIVQLGIVGRQSPEEAASRFFSARRIRRGDTAVGRINALPAVAAYFVAETASGLLGGIVAFISHGGQTFQLVGYTQAARLPAHDSSFRGSIGSFGALQDQAALAVQPRRLELVTLTQELSLSEFARQFPSAVDLQTLALINGLQGDPRLKAGTRLKRVREGR